MNSADSDARKALARLRRALEKANRELGALSGAVPHAQGGHFPSDAYQQADVQVRALLRFADEEGQRLQDRVLRAGGLDPEPIRRSSSL